MASEIDGGPSCPAPLDWREQISTLRVQNAVLLEALETIMSYESDMIGAYVPVTIREQARAAVRAAKGRE